MVVLLALLVGVAACTDDATTDAGGGPSDTVAPSADVDRAPVDPDAPVDSLVAGFNDAGFDLLRTLPVADDAVYSPLSVGHALLMARAAADDETGRAIDDAIGLPDGVDAHRAWNALDAALVASEGTAEALDGEPTPIVDLAGRLWPSTTAAPDQAWIDLLAAEHGAGVETIDTGAPDESRDRINAWVAEQTNDLIPELLPENFIDGNTVLVLTDAVYFKAQWRSIFGKYGEVVAPFTRLDGSTVDVTYLVDREQPGPRGRGGGFVGAELPYLGDDFALLLIVPEEGRFAEVRDRLSTDLLAEIDGAFTAGPYELHLPEWETATTIDLLPWLTDLGAAPGNYPGIGPGVFIDGAVHGADISVDEIGTEAAAATAIGFDESGAADPELVVAADKPYLYVVRHTPTGVVLFAGQVTDPTT
ncbi:MAG: serpin family protein [Acidimicrobiales bacterium]